MKKLASLFLALTLCMSLAVTASAAEVKSDLHTYKLSNDIIGTTEYVETQYIVDENYCLIPDGNGGWLTEEVARHTVYIVPAGTVVTNGDLYLSLSVYADGDGWGEEVAKSYTITEEGWIYNISTLSAEDQEYPPKMIAGEDDGIYLTVGTAAGTPAQSAVSFDDVKESDYFAQSVQWAVSEGITNGTSATTFSPDALCTKAHILTFVWRAEDGLEHPAASPYTDLNESEYFYNAAMWAFVNDLDPTDGGMGTPFNPDMPYTRANTVQLLWNIAGKPAPTTTVSFTDVPADAAYAQAVAWAVERGITNGTSATTFSPDATCTRGQIVTFLYRALG